MIRIVVSLAVLIAIIAATWYWFSRKQENKRRAKVEVLESMGFSVKREGIINDPQSHRDITSAVGRVQGCTLQLRVEAESFWNVTDQRSWYNPRTTVSTELRYTPPSLRIVNRRWEFGDRAPLGPNGDDGVEVKIGSATFDEGYVLWSNDGADVQRWFANGGADRFAAIPNAQSFVQIPDVLNGIRVRGNELSLCITRKSAEQLELDRMIAFVVEVAKLFDSIGGRIANENT